jgi:hypothetical protein
MEEILIKKIESGIRSIKFGTQTPETASVGVWLNKLKDINKGMYDDLLNNYKAVINKMN